jgi:hypothetical protein
MAALFTLQGCSNSNDPPPAKPTGYYGVTSTATVDDGSDETLGVDVRGTYGGLASTRMVSATDDTMTLTVSKSDFSVLCYCCVLE